MFEPFSTGYYLGRLYVEPATDEAAAMSEHQHERVNRQLYTDSDGVDRTDRPLIMKLGNRHFPVLGSASVPADRLAVPRSILEDVSITNPPALTEVLLATAERAAQLRRLSGGRLFGEDPPGI